MLINLRNLQETTKNHLICEIALVNLQNKKIKKIQNGGFTNTQETKKKVKKSDVNNEQIAI